MAKFKNIYRIESACLKEWDYSTPWWYYVTINTKNHIERFGNIENGEMILNELGKIAEDSWKEIPKHYKNVELDYFVIMPNHVHGVIIINPVETPYMASLPLGDIIGKFKAAVTRWCNKNSLDDFKWQSRFYDRIIRNEKELYRIRKYISENPLRWSIEKYIPENEDFL